MKKIFSWITSFFTSISSLFDDNLKCTKKLENETLLLSIDNSSKTTKNLLITYIIFQFIMLITIYNINDIDYLKNTNILLLLYNIEINVDFLTYFVPFAILIFQIVIIQKLLKHYYLIKKYLEIDKDLCNNIFILPSFAFNDINLYKLDSKWFFPTTYMILIILSIMPMWNLFFLLGYAINPIIIYTIIIITSFVNFILFFRIINKSLKPFIALVLGIGIIPTFIIIYTIHNINNDVKPFKDNTNTNNPSYTIVNNSDYLSYSRIILDDEITPINKLLVANLGIKTFDDIYQLRYANYFNGFTSDSRNLNNIFLAKTKLINSKFKFSELSKFTFNEVLMIKNSFFNSKLENFEFLRSNLIGLNFEGYYINSSNNLLDINDKTNIYYTTISNSTFYTNNKIIDCKFEKVKFDNIKFYGKNEIENSFFINNNYKNVLFNNTIISNTLFQTSNLGIEDKVLEERQNFLKQKAYYKKHKSPKYLLELEKEQIFQGSNLSNVTFNDIHFKNTIFLNTNFNNVKINDNTSFKNCTFYYWADKSNLKNKAFFEKIKKCTKCEYIVHNKNKTTTVISNNDGNITTKTLNSPFY